MSATPIITTRTLTVSPDIIMSLIEAQAGSMGKGLLECVMNSSDAGARKVEITMTNTGVLVEDDGKGFETRDEILQCFEVFGFKHDDVGTKFSKFGMGRAQLWSFMSTVWHTQNFVMDVDVKARGLDYELKENVSPAYPGLRIEGTFYEPQKTADILSTKRLLTELVLYMHIPVFFNGERINKEAHELKWTHETDDAWIQLNGNARELVVYNLGAKVCGMDASLVGVGGVVVTKPGVRLKLNMARNDILIAQCDVWRRIRPFLQAKSDEQVSSSKRPTAAQLANFAERILAGEIKHDAIDAHKLVEDVMGVKYTLTDFLQKAYDTLTQQVTVVAKSDAGPVTEASHKERYSFVLEQNTLRRFGVRSVAELLNSLKAITPNFVTEQYRGNRVDVPLAAIKPVEDWRKACKPLSSTHREVPYKEWNKRERAAMSVLKAFAYKVPTLLGHSGASGVGLNRRELRVGESETAQAWTDGSRCIWIERKVLEEMETGMAGVIKVVNVLVHEYLHDEDTAGSHVHGENFYERFHRAMMFTPAKKKWGMTVGEIVNFVLAGYVKELSKRGEKVKIRLLNANSAAESYAMGVEGVNDLGDAPAEMAA